jgi:CheY-like chemotaxis protein
MRQALHEWITITFPGYHVIEATNGEEAVAIVQVCSPHLVVMDIDLPGINGIQATARIKAMLPATPVVILSFHDDIAHRSQATTAGAEAFIPKNKLSRELQPVLSRLLPSVGQPILP